jgi:hypothetical protein
MPACEASRTARRKNATVEMAEVTWLDLAAREVAAVQLDGQPLTLACDSLVVAAGVGR